MPLVIEEIDNSETGVKRKIMANQKERRKNMRFPVDGKAIAVFKPYPILMGEVIDISLDGMGFYYHQENKWTETHSHRELELICVDGTRLARLPFEIVSDITIQPVLSTERKPIRRASLKFRELTADQVALLQGFITTYCANGGSSEWSYH